MEVVQDEQRRDEVVVGQSLRRSASSSPRELQDPGQAAAVELGDEADDVLHLLPAAAVE